MSPSAELAERFIGVILPLCGEFDKLLRTADAKVALGALAACEVVVRRAIDAALQRSEVQEAAFMADSLKRFLELSGRGNRAGVLSGQAEAAGDPSTSSEARRLLAQAISEQREALRLEEQLGRPASIAISHSNLAESLRRAGLLDEARPYAQEALAISERIGHPETWKTLEILEDIAEDRGDAGAAAEYRRRKEAAYQEAQERAGTPSLPSQAVVGLLQLALTARIRGDTLDEALSAAEAQDGLMATLDQQYPWLAVHLRALVGGEARPSVDVPADYAELVDDAWSAVP